MKTRNIALVLFAGVALLVTSCINEKDYFLTGLGKDDIAFKIGSVQTKAGFEEASISTESIASFKFGNKDAFTLEESVVSMDNLPITKGTPAFTENVVSLYGSFNAVANPGTDLSLPDSNFPFDEATNLWSHNFPNYEVWSRVPLTFYMRMPSDPAGVSGDYTYNTDGSIEFDYKTPSSAAGQQDILFSSATLTKEADNGKSITFYHALTGIKFSNFFTNRGITGANAVTKTIIKEVTIKGIKNSGHCKMELGSATSSTQSKTVAKWSNIGMSEGTTTTSYTISPSDTTNYKDSQYGLDTLLDNHATARNLNDDDGSLTFWFIPQSFADSAVMITIKCDVVLVKSDNTTTTTHSDEVITVSMGARTWQAGELHTFTLKPVLVGVEIDDEMSDYEKDDVVVTNTGNVYEYVRVNMIGNWVGYVQTAENVYSEEETILNGYTTSNDSNTTHVEAWNDKDGYTHYGTFSGLTPKSSVVPATSNTNNWVRYDKYYYYIKPIGPRDAITDQLFSSYIVGVSPEYWIPDKWGVRRKAKNVHLVMDLMVQAIPAPVDENGNVIDNDDNQGYIRAWVKALGKTSPNDLLDL